jgi:hypothetical protein
MKFKTALFQIVSLLFFLLLLKPLSAEVLSNDIDLELAQYFQIIPSAWKGHYTFAKWLVHEMQPDQVVDLGVDYGYSTFVFASALRENGKGIVTGIDLFVGDGMTGMRSTYAQVINNINVFSFNNVEIIKGDFYTESQQWNRSIDILHIDGYHSYEAVLNDFTNWSPFVKEDGIIVFHDINVPNPNFGLIQVFRELQGGRKLYFLKSYGLGIFTKNFDLAAKILQQFDDVYDFEKNPL